MGPPPLARSPARPTRGARLRRLGRRPPRSQRDDRFRAALARTPAPELAHRLAAGYGTAFFQDTLMGHTPSSLLEGEAPWLAGVESFAAK